MQNILRQRSLWPKQREPTSNASSCDQNKYRKHYRKCRTQSGRKRTITLILRDQYTSELQRLQQPWVIPTQFSRASNCVSKRCRVGMPGFSADLRLPFLAVLFKRSLKACWLMTASTPLDNVQEWLGILCKLRALPTESFAKSVV